MKKLIVKHCNDVFFIYGKIDNSNFMKLKNHLEFLLTYCKFVVINVDNVSFIDKKGISVFEELFTIAKLKNKKFKIEGYGSKDIYESLYNNMYLHLN